MNRFLTGHSLTTLLNDTLKVEKECNGESAAQWMDRVQDFVSGHASALSTKLKDFQAHLQAVITLTEQTVSALAERLDPSQGWQIENLAKTLEGGAPINIYKASWQRVGQSEELSPLLIQILPESACFDNLHFVVKLMTERNGEGDRQLGAVCGACDFAFGAGASDGSLGLWSRRLDERSGRTGGSCTDSPMLVGEEREIFLSAMRCIADSIIKLEPIINRFCQEQNDLILRVELERFLNSMTVSLRKLFPEEDGWAMSQKIEYGVDHGQIRFYKRHWVNDNPELGGDLSLAMGGFEPNFNDFYFGIAKSRPGLALAPNLCERLNQTLGKKYSDQWFPWYKRADADYRFWITAKNRMDTGEKLARVLEYYVNEFENLKKAIPIIDSMYAEPDKRDQAITSEETERSITFLK
jgi:hypothetical protein